MVELYCATLSGLYHWPAASLHGSWCWMSAASQETGHMSHLVSLLDSKTFEVSKNKPRCLLKGQSAMVEVTLSRTMCIETYKDYRALGRIALRDSGRTIAVGTVIQVFN